uniref:alpha-L-fucosidase n=1 Tax=Ciona savignyi TaxID=51511 RepID=H2YIK7_CIOSA
YNATWASLDTRPIPTWYDDAKLGIFIHWGVFSVPSFGHSPAWGWYYWKISKSPAWQDYMAKNFKPKFSYADFAKDFSTEFFNPDDWADLFAGGVGISHHEGYCNYPTNVSSWNWNSRDVGPHRDLVGELAHSIKNRTSMHFGLYHSLYEWFNPLYLEDKENKFQTNRFVAEKTLPELYELVKAYEPELIWSDGQWEAPSWYWNSTVFLQWLYNESPVKSTVVTNDRWGSDTLCKHGGFLTCNDRYNPKTHVPDKKWENAMTLNKGSWSWRRDTDISQFLTTMEMLSTFIETISCGGNMLMNVGPTKEGTISPIFGVSYFGAWLSINGEAVYGSKPFHVQFESRKETVVVEEPTPADGLTIYAFVMDWPADGILLLNAPMNATSTATITMLGMWGGCHRRIFTSLQPTGIAIEMPLVPISKLPHHLIWVLRLVGFQ